jgi:NTP pyrophosphatase (non-canonical NTP hydrolase)
MDHKTNIQELQNLLNYWSISDLNLKEVNEIFKNIEKRKEISEEMADVFYFLIRLAQMYNVDLATELNKKLEKNEQKYPKEKAKGSNKKYTEL